MQGTRVVAFYLDANQSGKDDDVLGNNYYDVTKLQIYFSQSKTVEAPNGGEKLPLPTPLRQRRGQTHFACSTEMELQTGTSRSMFQLPNLNTFKDHTTC